MKPNFFKYAKNELSHDAFLCYVLSFLEDNTNEYKYPREYYFSKFLLSQFFDKLNLEYTEIETIFIKQQFLSIDILLIINETIYIIIENKTFTSARENQIEDYRQKVIRHFKDDINVEKNLYAIYYKIENESTYNLTNIEKNINTSSFLRAEIIKTFNFYSGDDILINQYFEHCLGLEASRSNFTNIDLTTDSFTKAEIIGYYDALDAIFTQLKKSGLIKKDVDYNWAYKGGMKCCLYCFYFTNVASFKNYGFYIQLESTAFKNKTRDKNLKLVVKLWIDEKSKEYSVEDLKKSFLILKNHFGERVKPPARFKVGKWCTTAIIENYITLDEFGAVDLEKTAATIVNYCNELRSLKKKLQDF